MLADKLLPSFYVIEVEGKAVDTIIPGNFAIQKISIGSRDFTNDMFALAALSDAMQFIVLNPDLDKSTAEEKLDYNPEFFPTMQHIPSPEETKRQQDAEDAADEATEALGIPGRIAVPITRVFDQLGDFVESRWLIESPDFRVQGKVAINPDRYMHQKVLDMEVKHGEPQLKSSAPQVYLH
jgi:hypothetical protein